MNQGDDGVTVEGLALARGDRVLFRHLNFALQPGVATILTGPNGAGKSTLLRAVAGLLPPHAGRILRAGKPIADEPDRHRADLAFLGHLDGVKPLLSLRENLDYWARGDRPAVIRALDEWGLGARAGLPARFLSAGLKRRLALARLSLRAVGLWLLDEPTTALDRASVGLFEAALGRHLAGGGMALIATHLDLGGADAARLELGG